MELPFGCLTGEKPIRVDSLLLLPCRRKPSLYPHSELDEEEKESKESLKKHDYIDRILDVIHLISI